MNSKKWLLSVTFILIFVTFSFSQIPELKLSPNVVSSNISGGSIKKGDTVKVSLLFKPAAGKPVRSFYLDFQHQITAINMIDVVFPTAGTQGSAIPAGAQTSYTNNYYPGYNFNRNVNNTTESGQTNSGYASYIYTQGGNKAINRIWAVSSGDLVEGKLCDIRFKIMEVAAGFSYDSIYYNFAQAFSGNYGGSYWDVKMPKPNSSWVDVLATSNALINGELKLNSLVDGYTPQVIIVDSLTGVVKTAVTPAANGLFTLTNQVSPNTAYKAYVAFKSDSLPSIFNKAITVSDYTAAAAEFVKQNLDGTFTNTNIASGVGFLAADINSNKNLDGGDLTGLFAQAVGVDTIFKAAAGQSLYNVPAFLGSVYDTLTLAGYKALTDVQTVHFRTGDTARSLSIRYIVPGDVNRSHSSIRTQAQNVTTYKLNNIPSARVGYINTPSENIQNIEVSLNNLTVTSNEFTIPIVLDSKQLNLSALQFEFVYDASKVKFESIKADMPSWIVFVNSTPGHIKFGAIDRDMKYPYTGSNVTPFKLVFSTLQNGLDINSTIKVTSNMDASDNKGNQLGILLNSTTIKLTGYNNF
ncbi:MAG: hypothetical protein EBR30_01815 [Cytophagia bacterium]|nr:hypothetical protein [Cytophagia bacterium]